MATAGKHQDEAHAKHSKVLGNGAPPDSRAPRTRALACLALLCAALTAPCVLYATRAVGPSDRQAREAASKDVPNAAELGPVMDPKEPEEVPEPSLSGWVEGEDGALLYYDPDTHLRHRGWLEADGSRFYCDEETGAVHTGWLEIDGKSYWLDDGGLAQAGALLRDRWLSVDGKSYHLSSDGTADEGWCEVDGQMYCLDDAGAMRTGWATGDDGNCRWLKSEDGTMARHEWVEIDGLWQAFDDDGSWVTRGEVIPPNDADNMANLSARQSAVIAACDYTPWPGKALCAAWVSAVFSNAGEPGVGGDACDIARAWCVSDNLSELKPGMVIAVTSHSRTENGRIWGHVCIYVGNGIVRDSGTYGIRRIELGSWLAWFGVTEEPRWGWANGIVLG